jgi:hypothetical protein
MPHGETPAVHAAPDAATAAVLATRSGLVATGGGSAVATSNRIANEP